MSRVMQTPRCRAAAGVQCKINASPAARSMRRVGILARSVASDTASTEVKLVGPDPQRFVVAEGELQNIASAAFAAVLRLGSGALCSGYRVSFERETEQNKGQYSVLSLPLGFRVKETSAVGGFNRPEEPITIYERQDCIGSRKVREVASILDIDILFLPCPQGGPTWGPEAAAAAAAQKSGSSASASASLDNTPALPFMIDSNTGFEMNNADEIVAYLFRTYGNRTIPLPLRPGVISEMTAKAGLAPRKGAGGQYSPSRVPAKPLEFWAYEASPFCVVVKEVLAELEIPHVQKSCARGSPRRQQLLDRRGHFQVPYIEDPNEGVALFESSAIIEHLRKTYGSGGGRGRNE